MAEYSQPAARRCDGQQKRVHQEHLVLSLDRRTASNVRQAITDLDRQRSQLRLNGRTFLVDVVMQTPDRFSSAVKSALEAELPSLRPAVVRSRFDFREKHHDLRYEMRLACHIIMQDQGAIEGAIESVRSPIHVVTPYNIPAPPTG